MDMDTAAIMDSEVMRSYLENELKKEKQQQTHTVAHVNEDEVVEAFHDFEDSIKKDAKKLAVFKTLQRKFSSDVEYAKKCNPLFVQAVMMLDLDE